MTLRQYNSRYTLQAYFASMNLLAMKKVVVAWAPRPETSRPANELAAKKPVSTEVGPSLERLKKLCDSPALTPKLMLAPEVLRGEGSS
ncbi:hypothetical protein BHE74_00020288 [Ensete ventricosum]|nr:hypothetical protein BHE74_00020288 [Ensete ventricosum]